jgi:hypothetical protein
MRKLTISTGDSLDLLLDTLCNVFGGIILLACLIALFPSQSGNPFPARQPTEAQGLLLERRLAAADEELKGLQQLLDQPDHKGRNQLSHLEGERKELQAILDNLREDKTEKNRLRDEMTLAPNPTVTLGPLRRELAQLRLQIADTEALTEAAMAKKKALLKRLNNLREEAGLAGSSQVQMLRFPRERSPTKKPTFLILKGGQVFPVYDFNGNLFSGLSKTVEQNGDFSLRAKRGQGLSPVTDLATVKKILQTCLRNDMYIIFLVFADSYDEFRSIKAMAVQSGIDYGLNTFGDHEPIMFSDKGEAAPPL